MVKMAKQTKQISEIWFEQAVSVRDYGKGEAAFNKAENDVKKVKVLMEEEIKESGIEQLTVGEIEFLEFDSGNWTHAGAYFNCQVVGEIALVEQFNRWYNEKYE